MLSRLKGIFRLWLAGATAIFCCSAPAWGEPITLECQCVSHKGHREFVATRGKAPMDNDACYKELRNVVIDPASSTLEYDAQQTSYIQGSIGREVHPIQEITSAAYKSHDPYRLSAGGSSEHVDVDLSITVNRESLKMSVDLGVKYGWTNVEFWEEMNRDTFQCTKSKRKAAPKI